MTAGCTGDDAEQTERDSGTPTVDADDADVDGSRDAPDATEQQAARIQVLQEAHGDSVDINLRTEDGTYVEVASALEPRNAALAEVEPGTVSFTVRDAQADHQLATLDQVQLDSGGSYLLAVVGVQDPERRPNFPSNPDGADIGVQLVLEELAPASAFTGLRLLQAVPDAGQTSVSFNGAQTPQVDGVGLGEFSATTEIEPYLGTPASIARITLGRSQGEFVIDKQTPELDAGLHGTIVVRGFVEEETRNNQFTDALSVGFYPDGSEGPSQPLFATATVRTFHQSPDAGPLELRAAGETVVEKIAFREATGLIPAPSQYEIRFEFVARQGERAGEVVASEQLFLQPDTLQTLFAAGLIDDSNNDVLDNTDFDMQVFTDRISLPVNLDEQRTLIWGFYSATDEFVLNFTPKNTNHRMFENMYFGDWMGPVERDASEDIVLDLELPGSELFGRYNLPLASENLGGEHVMMVASGYLTPEGEDGRDDAPAFELRLYLLDGTEIELHPLE